MYTKEGHRSIGYACNPSSPHLGSHKPGWRSPCFDYGQLAWLALPQFPYLESEVQVAVLGIGEVKIFQTHPICGSSLQHKHPGRRVP